MRFQYRRATGCWATWRETANAVIVSIDLDDADD
jgi:hypothetical protein